MKKLVLFLIICVAFIFGAYQIKADEEEPVSEEPTTEETDEMTEEEFKLAIEDYLSQYIERDTVQKIIGWLTDAGVLASLFVVYLKYRKYKKNTVEEVIGAVKKEIGDYLTKNFEKLSQDEIDKVKQAIKSLESSNEVIMKVLVLMQDNTAKGKTALIDYLGSKTESDEVKQATEDVKETLEQQEEIREEAFEKVEKDYQEIF